MFYASELGKGWSKIWTVPQSLTWFFDRTVGIRLGMANAPRSLPHLKLESHTALHATQVNELELDPFARGGQLFWPSAILHPQSLEEIGFQNAFTYYFTMQ